MTPELTCKELSSRLHEDADTGLTEAERLGMPYEEALLLSAMLQHGDLSEKRATNYRERATAIFEMLGAAPDLASLGVEP